MRLRDVGEFGLIDLIRRGAAQGKGVVRGIGDDAAVLEFNAQEYLLFTTDMLVEGVHFLRSMGGRSIGQKAMGCNISDIAAMGGIPTYATVSLGVSPLMELKFVQDIYRGLTALAKKFNVSIVGGDTVKSEKLVINVALLGRVRKNQLVTRDGAKAGDVIFVTGRLGRSLSTGKHLTFTPRIQETHFLTQKFRPTSMIDISDGLAADLGHILDESGAGAEIFSSKIPCAAGVSLDNALYDGEDFELLFTLPQVHAARLCAAKTKFHFHEIGRILKKQHGLKLVEANGSKVALKPKGFTHF